MNIFVPYPDVKRNAEMLDDLRLSKMVLESAQMLCAALRRHGGGDDDLYRISHANHPCTIWTGDTRSNFMYLVRLGRAIERERLERLMNPSKSILMVEHCAKFKGDIPTGKLTPFVNCTSDFKSTSDVHEAYQNQMGLKWSKDVREPNWRFRGPPPFYNGWDMSN